MSSKLGVRIGNRLRARREAIGWSQAQLAEAGGVSANYIGVVERGEKLPTLETLEKLASALGVRVELVGPVVKGPVDEWAAEVAAMAPAVPRSLRRVVLATLAAAVQTTGARTGGAPSRRKP